MFINIIPPYRDLKCPNCGCSLVWGVTTKMKKNNSEVCCQCMAVLGKEE